MATAPPPLPHEKRRRAFRWKIPLIIIGGILGCLLLLAAIGALYVFTARDFTPNDAQKEAVVTAAYASEWFDLNLLEGTESWDCKRYFDRSKEIFYYYAEEYITLDCTLTIERNIADASVSYAMEWQALKLGNRFEESAIKIEYDNDIFRWGDLSKFAFQSIDGERNGFAFIARKGTKVFFIDAWGLLFDDPSTISDFLTPKLEQYERTSF